MSVTVAVTNYNGLSFLPGMLDQLRGQGMGDIVILDDGSTDGSVEYLEEQTGIVLVKGEENLGPTGNRNRMLELPAGDIILFLDIDMDLVSPGVAPALEREFSRHQDVAVAGALIFNKRNERSWASWGYDFTPYRWGAITALMKVYAEHHDDPKVMATLRRAAKNNVAYLEPVEHRSVDWIVEQFFAIRTSVFRELGGFDPRFRMFHEGPDLCLRVRNAGHKVHWVPSIQARHMDLHSGTNARREQDNAWSTVYYFAKHVGISAEQLTRLMAGR